MLSIISHVVPTRLSLSLHHPSFPLSISLAMGWQQGKYCRHCNMLCKWWPLPLALRPILGSDGNCVPVAAPKGSNGNWHVAVPARRIPSPPVATLLAQDQDIRNTEQIFIKPVKGRSLEHLSTQHYVRRLEIFKVLCNGNNCRHSSSLCAPTPLPCPPF